MTISYSYPHQIGGVILNPTDGDNEYDYILSREENHATGTVNWTLDAFQGEQVYSRSTPNTSDWRAQVMVDVEEEVRARNPGAEVYVHVDDQE